MTSLQKVDRLAVINGEAYRNLISEIVGAINLSIDLELSIDMKVVMDIIEDSLTKHTKRVQELADY